jgi:hypothetical protein
MKNPYFVLLIVGVTAASAAKAQVDPREKTNVPDSVRTLSDYYLKVEKLGEYQKEKRKLASSIRTGDVMLTVHIIPRSFFREDSGKNVIVAFINEEWKNRPKVAYIVRFDSAHQILSVDKHHAMSPEEKTLALAAPSRRE